MNAPIALSYKVCGKCDEYKQLDNFYASSTSSYCKECLKRNRREHYKLMKDSAIGFIDKNREARRNYIINYLKSHACIDCGIDDLVVLEFDHRSDKIAGISQLIASGSMVRLMAEVAKCDVRCANCHKRRTAKQFGSYRLKALLEGAK